MRRFRTWLIPLALCAFLLRGGAFVLAGQTQKPVVFPAVTAYSLDRQKIDLPSGFEGQLDLLMISFQQEQMKDLEVWLPVAQAIQHSNFNFRYYRMPVSSRENMLFRWWGMSSMRSDESDPETWHWIIPLYVDKDEFRKSLHISDEKQVVLLLVDRQGHILWRASGALTADKRASLLAATEAH